MARKTTQNDRVLQYIKDFGSITRLEAMNDVGVANLPAVINTLRNNGTNIITREIEAVNRYGEKITYAKYTLGEEYGSKDISG